MWLNVELHSSSAEDTMAIGAALGALLVPGDVVALSGELGAGKTVFCKGVGGALGIPPDRIVSPSFTIVTEHEGSVTLRHVDAYRLASVAEAEGIGLEELLRGDAVCVVEWAERLAPLLPNHCIKVKFLILDDDARRVDVSAEDGPRLREFVTSCQRYLPGG